MRDEEWRKIKAHHHTFVDDLDLKRTTIIDFLYSKEVLSDHDKEALTNEQNSVEQNRIFLKILKKKPDPAYGYFCQALEKDQPHLLKFLKPPKVPLKPPGSGAGL